MKRRKQENEENKKKKTMSDRERDREGERIVCELLDCMYSFFHIYTMNGATRASDGIFKTVISNVVLCKRGHRKYYITHLYQMLGKYVDHRWSHARKRSLGVCTHTIRSTSILCTAVRTKSLNKNLTLNLVTGNNKLIPKNWFEFALHRSQRTESEHTMVLYVYFFYESLSREK